MTPHQKQALNNLVLLFVKSQSEWVTGRTLRSKLRGIANTLETQKALAASLAPDHAEHNEANPNEDLFRPNLAGLLSCYPPAQVIICLTLKFFSEKADLDPEFRSFTWDELKRSFAKNLADPEDADDYPLLTVQRVFEVAGLASRWYGTNWGVPDRIEELCGLKSVEDLLLWRADRQPKTPAPSPPVLRSSPKEASVGPAVVDGEPRTSSTLKTPRVFISYSHDSPDHKKWVASIASRLVSNGVDVTLDQWELKLGSDLPKFMERSVAESDRVLMICTENYVRKANNGSGGTGYEAMIVTGELIQALGSTKFIPVVCQCSEPVLPRSLSTRLFIDFSDPKQFDTRFEELVREIHQAPVAVKPPLGENPFRSQGQSPKAAEAGASSPLATYRTALELARNEDSVGWRKHLHIVRRQLQGQATAWVAKNRTSVHPDDSQLPAFVDSGVEPFVSLIALAVAGVESTHTHFRNQIAVIDDILHSTEYHKGGHQVVEQMPYAALYIYQGLHGAVALDSGQLAVALGLALSPIQEPNSSKERRLMEVSDAIGWPDSLGGKPFPAWAYLTTLPDRWPWVNQVFDSPGSYRAALVAYYVLLSIAELADMLANGREHLLREPTKLLVDVPVCFVMEDTGVLRKATRMLLAHADDVAAVWRQLHVSDANMLEAWKPWTQIFSQWRSKSEGGWSWGVKPPLQEFLETIVSAGQTRLPS